MYIEHKKPHLPAGFQALTVGNTAVGLTVPTDARYAILRVITEDIRYRDDGTNPTGTVGMLAKVDEFIELTSRQQLAAFKAIRDGGSNGGLEILYYKI
jgi:hypothetical protein